MPDWPPTWHTLGVVVLFSVALVVVFHHCLFGPGSRWTVALSVPPMAWAFFALGVFWEGLAGLAALCVLLGVAERGPPSRPPLNKDAHDRFIADRTPGRAP